LIFASFEGYLETHCLITKHKFNRGKMGMEWEKWRHGESQEADA
jgi:hypothetical protein